MGEARVLRPLVGEQGEAELLDAAQPLELERVYEAHHQAALVRVGAEADDVVYRVAVDAFGHFLSVFPEMFVGTSRREYTTAHARLIPSLPEAFMKCNR